MLAQNFLNAEQLGITERQHAALIKTLVLMETGRLVHVKPMATKPIGRDVYDHAHLLQFTGHFNMDHWRVLDRNDSCQTICCIGGTAELVGNVRFINQRWCDENLNDLFFPPTASKRTWRIITVEKAARALRNYLSCGAPKWDEVLHRTTRKRRGAANVV